MEVFFRTYGNKTKKSTKFAVLVMREEDKNEARESFQTPLIFSIQEAKGLEYDNIILYNFISKNHKEFQEISRDVLKSDLEKELVFFLYVLVWVFLLSLSFLHIKKKIDACFLLLNCSQVLPRRVWKKLH
jgi:hypothetical protein